MTVPRCKNCESELALPVARRHHYYCKDDAVVKVEFGHRYPRLMYACDHRYSPPWCPKRRKGERNGQDATRQRKSVRARNSQHI